MSKKKNVPVQHRHPAVRRHRAGSFANREVIMMYWEIGQYIGSVLLGNERAEYGKRIVSEVATQLSWSHFIEILPLKNNEERMYYANEAATRHLGTKELRQQISRKVSFQQL